MIKLKGIAASPGIAIAKAYCVGSEDLSVLKSKIAYADISREIYRLEEALIDTRKEIINLQKKISADLGFSEAKIFEAHLLVLEDRVLIEDVIQQIKNKKVNVEYAFAQSIKKYVSTLLNLDDDYLRERVLDIEDIGKRVLRKLLKRITPSLAELKSKAVVVAHVLSPSETATLPKGNILGFVTDIGGSTSHAAIIARSLSMPAVVGVEVATKHIKGNETVIVSGSEGLVIVNPTERVLKEYKDKASKFKKAARVAVIPKDVKVTSIDGKSIVVSANVEFPEELPLVSHFGAEGVGLYRTEYIFLGKNILPSEEEQFQAYINVARKVKPNSVIVRTIDIGGDKFLSRPEMPRELTPFLGWRAIRFCLARQDIFKAQLRAILRASVEKNIKIMFPMISGISELRQAKAVLESCKKELIKEGKEFDQDIKVGMMIEVPSAALIADALAKECDFFSIGTNDLIQYTLAVDRADEKVAYLYEPAHPAVLKLIKSTIDAAHKNNIWVGMCGEMAGELMFTLLLLGFGIDELSMPPPRVPKIKELIAKLDCSQVKKMISGLVDLATPREVEIKLTKYLKDSLKGDYEKIVGV